MKQTSYSIDALLDFVGLPDAGAFLSEEDWKDINRDLEVASMADLERQNVVLVARGEIEDVLLG